MFLNFWKKALNNEFDKRVSIKELRIIAEKKQMQIHRVKMLV